MTPSQASSGGGSLSELRMFAVVPLPPDAGGAGELLMLPLEDGWVLPGGVPLPGELLLDAAARIVLAGTGLSVRTERLVYFLEVAGVRAWVVLCNPVLDAENGGVNETARFVDPRAVEGFEPRVVRELLLEDLAGGFLRPVAHVTALHPAGPVSVNW